MNTQTRRESEHKRLTKSGVLTTKGCEHSSIFLSLLCFKLSQNISDPRIRNGSAHENGFKIEVSIFRPFEP